MKEITYKVIVNSEGRFWYLNDQLHREDGPAIERSNGTKEWYINGECHRLDGPAVEYANGFKEWYINGERHRLDGPAIEYGIGTKEWYINGEQLTGQEFIQRTSTPEYTMEQLVNLVGHNFKIKKND